MPTTRSTLPVNRSGLQRGQHESKRKRSIGNADEQARKRHKDKINSDIDEEEGKQKMKGGRDGKKAKGRKKAKQLRFADTGNIFWYSTNHWQFYRKTSLDKAQEEAAAKEAAKAYK